MKIAYQHILDYLDETPSINEISKKLFQLGHEHEIVHNIFDIEITPNRGDCLSLKGICNDLSIFYKTKQNFPIYTDEIPSLDIEFQNNSQDICNKISFLKIEIEDVPNNYSANLHNYFVDLEVKKNNFFTDISNYILYETGQPTHCYDFNKIKGQIEFCEIKKDYKFQTLLNKTINLTDTNYVFVNNNKIINLAGVVGGLETACSVDTKTVLVECAYFKPESIIGKTIKYDIQSDAAYRFERGTDIHSHENTLRRLIQIVSEHATIKNIQIFSQDLSELKKNKIEYNLNKIKKILGIDLSDDEYRKILKKLKFNFNNEFIEIPSYRNDINGQNDIAEEIARVIGYNNIKNKEINISNKLAIQNKPDIEIFKFNLVENGFYETINNPFVSDKNIDSVKLDNPLDKNKPYLRTNLKNSLLKNLIYNHRRQKDTIKFFEISDVYFKNNYIKSKTVIGIIASGRVDKNYRDFSKKINQNYISTILSPFLVDEKNLVIEELEISEVGNKIYYIEIPLTDIKLNGDLKKINLKTRTDFIKYKPISEFPSSNRDLSFLVKDHNMIETLCSSMLSYKHKNIKEIFIFDFFINNKTNQVKIGFRFIFQSKLKTLTDREVDEVMSEVISNSLDIPSVEIPGLKYVDK